MMPKIRQTTGEDESKTLSATCMSLFWWLGRPFERTGTLKNSILLYRYVDATTSETDLKPESETADATRQRVRAERHAIHDQPQVGLLTQRPEIAGSSDVSAVRAAGSIKARTRPASIDSLPTLRIRQTEVCESGRGHIC